MSHDDAQDQDVTCEGGCGRRAFLKGSAGLLTLGALFGGDLAAMPLSAVRAVTRRGAALTYPIPATDGATIDRDEGVIIARSGGQVFALSLTCPHQNTALRWQAGANEFQCPKHKSRYQPDGRFIAGRATRAMDRFAITRDGGSVVVDVDRLFQQDEQAAEWAAAVIKV